MLFRGIIFDRVLGKTERVGLSAVLAGVVFGTSHVLAPLAVYESITA